MFLWRYHTCKDGSDVIQGSSADDNLYGDDGNDELYGGPNMMFFKLALEESFW